ncbi:hypothetical protein PM082_009153 [Marasmius tenuissimus]|nr:hypothetical protein PM082_009153 [Marasmius tenuissimus]
MALKEWFVRGNSDTNEEKWRAPVEGHANGMPESSEEMQRPCWVVSNGGSLSGGNGGNADNPASKGRSAVSRSLCDDQGESVDKVTGSCFFSVVGDIVVIGNDVEGGAGGAVDDSGSGDLDSSKSYGKPYHDLGHLLVPPSYP